MKATATSITDIEYIESCNPVIGEGNYSATITMRGVTFSINEFPYDYSYEDQEIYVNCSPDGSDNDDDIYKEAEKAGVAINEENVEEVLEEIKIIIKDLERQVGSVITERYGINKINFPSSGVGQKMLAIILSEPPRGEAITAEIDRIEREAAERTGEIKEWNERQRNQPKSKALEAYLNHLEREIDELQEEIRKLEGRGSSKG